MAPAVRGGEMRPWPGWARRYTRSGARGARQRPGGCPRTRPGDGHAGASLHPPAGGAVGNAMEGQHDGGLLLATREDTRPARRSWAWMMSGASLASSCDGCPEAAQVRLGPHVNRLQEAPGQPARGDKDAGPTMVTSGPPARPATSSATLTVRSTGPPRSWVSRKTTFMADRPCRLARPLIAPRGPRTLRPPAMAARNVASEKSSTKLRGNTQWLGRWPPPAGTGRHRGGEPGRGDRGHHRIVDQARRIGKGGHRRAQQVLEVFLAAPDFAFQLTRATCPQIGMGTAVRTDGDTGGGHLQQLGRASYTRVGRADGWGRRGSPAGDGWLSGPSALAWLSAQASSKVRTTRRVRAGAASARSVLAWPMVITGNRCRRSARISIWRAKSAGGTASRPPSTSTRCHPRTATAGPAGSGQWERSRTVAATAGLTGAPRAPAFPSRGG